MCQTPLMFLPISMGHDLFFHFLQTTKTILIKFYNLVLNFQNSRYKLQQFLILKEIISLSYQILATFGFQDHHSKCLLLDILKLSSYHCLIFIWLFSMVLSLIPNWFNLHTLALYLRLKDWNESWSRSANHFLLLCLEQNQPWGETLLMINYQL